MGAAEQQAGVDLSRLTLEQLSMLREQVRARVCVCVCIYALVIDRIVLVMKVERKMAVCGAGKSEVRV